MVLQNIYNSPSHVEDWLNVRLNKSKWFNNFVVTPINRGFLESSFSQWFSFNVSPWLLSEIHSRRVHRIIRLIKSSGPAIQPNFLCFVQYKELLNKIVEIKWKRNKVLYQHGQRKERCYVLSVVNKFVKKRWRLEEEDFAKDLLSNLSNSSMGNWGCRAKTKKWKTRNFII